MKISWSEALKSYLLDEKMSYVKIAQIYGISKVQVARKAKKECWQELREKTKQNVSKMLPITAAETVAQTKSRHIEAGRLLQNLGLDILNFGDLKPTNFREVRETIMAGIKIEREALELDRVSNQTNIQNNYLSTAQLGELIRKKVKQREESEL